MLSKGDAITIEDIKIVYRGAPSRSKFKMDVYVLDFDREMPFTHTLEVAKAKNVPSALREELRFLSEST